MLARVWSMWSRLLLVPEAWTSWFTLKGMWPFQTTVPQLSLCSTSCTLRQRLWSTLPRVKTTLSEMAPHQSSLSLASFWRRASSSSMRVCTVKYLSKGTAELWMSASQGSVKSLSRSTRRKRKNERTFWRSAPWPLSTPSWSTHRGSSLLIW